MRWPWRRRWRAVIVGQESGNRCPLSFVTFRTEEKARAWCEKENASLKDHIELTRYEYEQFC